VISVSDLGKSFGPQVLFSGVSLQMNPGNRYGLVGANGSGKSTFLKVLTGEELASEGSLNLPKRLRLGVLSQDQYAFEDTPIIEVAMMGHAELWKAMAEKEALLANADQEFDGDRYAELEEIVMRNDGYALEARAAEILEGLGIPAEIHRQPMSTLSGGFKLRVLLAQVLASDPDALLLDEPTNHLDILSIRWLEKFLNEFPGLVVVISHDHRFLENVCTHILDVDYETVTLYPGSYAAFTEAKAAERERVATENERREKKIAEHQAFVDRFRAKATKARQAQSKQKLIAKMADDLVPLAQSSRRYPRFVFKQVRPSGKAVAEVEGISKAYGDNQVLDGVSFTLERGDRMAVIGPNGIGKSTLLKILVGELAADAGEVEWGYETYRGYFAQDHRDLLDEESKQSVEAWLWEKSPGEPIGFVRGQLGQVLFSGDDVKKTLQSLSGGEAARLVFAGLAVTKPNVLILDEPTNHLDLEAIEALIEALKTYDGTLIFVSHDRWFVSQLADRIFEITPHGIQDFRGDYDEYLTKCGDDHLDSDSVLLKARKEKRRAKQEKKTASPQRDRERDRRRRELTKRRDEITDRVEKAEERIHAINDQFCDPSFFDRTPRPQVQKLETEQKRLSTEVETLMEEWETVEKELEELTAVMAS
jgi:ATPase subunit of ABC transporter with duplicated ATPase domains